MNDKFSLEILPVGVLETNCYLVSDPASLDTLIVDPGGEAEQIMKVIKEKKLKPAAIVNTHGHADHTGANEAIKKYFGIKIYIHRLEADFLKDPFLNGSSFLPESITSESSADVLLDDGSELKIGGLAVKVVHTPGHTPGCQCFSAQGHLFTGDTLFIDVCGRCDLPGSDPKIMYNSLYNVLMKLPDATVIYSGHNYGPYP